MKNPLSVLKLIILLTLTSFSLSSFADWPYLYCVTADPPSNSVGYRELNYMYLYENRTDMFKDFVTKYGSNESNKKNATKITWSTGYNYLQIFVDDQNVVTLPEANNPYNAARFVYNFKTGRKPSVLTFENSKEANAFCCSLRSLCVKLWENAWGYARDTGKVTRASYTTGSVFSLIVLYQEKNNATGDLIEKPMICSPPTEFNGTGKKANCDE